MMKKDRFMPSLPAKSYAVHPEASVLESGGLAPLSPKSCPRSQRALQATEKDGRDALKRAPTRFRFEDAPFLRQDELKRAPTRFRHPADTARWWYPSPRP